MEIISTQSEKLEKLSHSSDNHKNEVEDELYSMHLRKKYALEFLNSKINKNGEADSKTGGNGESIPEIKDIYDHIYGNVQTKLEFYENKRNSISGEPRNSPNSKPTTPSEDSKNSDKSFEGTLLSIKAFSADDDESKALEGSTEFAQNHEKAMNDLNTPTFETKLLQGATGNSASDEITHKKSEEVKTHSLPNLTPFDTKTSGDGSFEKQQEIKSSITDPPKALVPAFNRDSNVESLDHKNWCTNCQRADYISDRTEVLTEINASLTLELEGLKQELKKEVAKNNELNFEIANIEAALETYYKEAKGQKSTLASIYSAMKTYATDQRGDFQESYTYKRIRTIADYMESLKSKLEHQDRIIKSNFVENPYYTDLITKHDAILRQLDEMSKENHELRNELEKKAEEELETIKELNRQKFQAENKCREMERRHEKEIEAKKALILSTEEKYEKQLKECQVLMERKNEEVLEAQKIFQARVNNYKQELLIVYRKWKEQKMLSSSQK